MSIPTLAGLIPWLLQAAIIAIIAYAAVLVINVVPVPGPVRNLFLILLGAVVMALVLGLFGVPTGVQLPIPT